MKKLLILNIFILSCLTLTAQEVVSSGGETNTVAGYEISWTVGEPVILTLSNESNILTQGFHQTKLIVTPIFSLVNNLKIKVYPNPITQRVFIDVELQQNFHYELYNASGKLLKKNTLELAINEINMEALANGTYFLKIHDKKNLVRTYKLVKFY